MKLKNDLTNPKNFNRSDYELQEFLLLCIFVAGKNSKTQSEKLALFLDELNPGLPLASLRQLTQTEIYEKLIKAKSGQYKRLSKCLFDLSRSEIDLRSCSTEDLENIFGVGMKTSRFFIVYSRENSRYAILDVHILNFIRSIHSKGVPRSTPTSKKAYLFWEDTFLRLCDAKNMSPQDYDLEIWLSRQRSWKV